MKGFHIDIAPMVIGTVLLALIWVTTGLTPDLSDRMILSGVHNALGVIEPILILVVGVCIMINLVVRIWAKSRNA